MESSEDMELQNRAKWFLSQNHAISECIRILSEKPARWFLTPGTTTRVLELQDISILKSAKTAKVVPLRAVPARVVPLVRNHLQIRSGSAFRPRQKSEFRQSGSSEQEPDQVANIIDNLIFGLPLYNKRTYLIQERDRKKYSLY